MIGGFKKFQKIKVPISPEKSRDKGPNKIGFRFCSTTFSVNTKKIMYILYIVLILNDDEKGCTYKFSEFIPQC